MAAAYAFMVSFAFFNWSSISVWLSSISVWLLLGDVVATLVVGAGLLMETPENPTCRQRAALWLIVVGIIAETVCSIFLFAHDESVSQAQSAKMIALETELAPRTLTKGQADALLTVLRGKVREITVTAVPALEPQQFLAQISDVLIFGGIHVVTCPSPFAVLTGISFWTPGSAGNDTDKNPAFLAFAKAGLTPTSFGSLGTLVSTECRKDIPLVVIGERPMKYRSPPYFGAKPPR